MTMSNETHIELQNLIGTSEVVFYIGGLQLLKKKGQKIAYCQVIFKMGGMNVSEVSSRKFLRKEMIKNGHILSLNPSQQIKLRTKNNTERLTIHIEVGKCSGIQNKTVKPKLIAEFAFGHEDISDKVFGENSQKSHSLKISEVASSVDLLYKFYVKNAPKSESAVAVNEYPNKEEFQMANGDIQFDPNVILPDGIASGNGPDAPSWEAPIDKNENIPKLTFHPNSCIVVLGQLKRGKTTTMNLYTDNEASTGEPNRVSGETNKPKLYEDKRNSKPRSSCSPKSVIQYPLWLDTPGLAEGDAVHSDEALIKSCLMEMKAGEVTRDDGTVVSRCKISWIHAIIWNIRPEGELTAQLCKEAEFIKQFLGETKEWKAAFKKNVIVIVNPQLSSIDERNTLGAKAVINQVVGDSSGIPFLQYKLTDEASKDNARKELHKAICKIEKPVKVLFSKQVCQDCGLVGDWRLLDNHCHFKMKEKDIHCFKIQTPFTMKQCSVCKGKWSGRQWWSLFMCWAATSGTRCTTLDQETFVPSSDTREVKKEHRMVPKRWYMIGGKDGETQEPEVDED